MFLIGPHAVSVSLLLVLDTKVYFLKLKQKGLPFLKKTTRRIQKIQPKSVLKITYLRMFYPPVNGLIHKLTRRNVSNRRPSKDAPRMRNFKHAQRVFRKLSKMKTIQPQFFLLYTKIRTLRLNRS